MVEKFVGHADPRILLQPPPGTDVALENSACDAVGGGGGRRWLVTTVSLQIAAPLVDALRATAGPVLVVTGAGVSAASGISTFRGSEPDAVWRQHDVSMATVAMFDQDPVSQLDWYLERFATVDTAQPNAGHRALAELEREMTDRGARFLLVTQNIDTLHEQAGTRRLIKVHGTADRLRCGRAGCSLAAPSGSISRQEIDFSAFRRAPGAATLPLCKRCGSPLRPHVLFFDEYYSDHDDYRFREVEDAAASAALILFVGTSFAVGVTSLVLQAGTGRNLPMFSVDPAGARLAPIVPIHQLSAPAEALLPLVVEALRG